jgi:hypothetical protein
MNEKLEFIYSNAKKIISEYYPEELHFFEPIWAALKDLLTQWKDKRPEDWPIRRDFQPKLLESLGAVGGGVNLFAPSIMLLIAACIVELTRMENPKEKIKEVVQHNTEDFLPQVRYEEKRKIREHLIPLLKIDVSRWEAEAFKMSSKGKIKLNPDFRR